MRSLERACANTHMFECLSVEELEDAVKYMLEKNALLLPGRIPGYKKYNVQLLPSSCTKKGVWQLYESANEKVDGKRVVRQSTFRKLWNKYTPHVITKPRSDLCWTCQKYSTALIRRSVNTPEESRSEVSQLHVN